MEEIKETKIVNILPLGKGKRTLLFLADFFINFILAFTLLNVVVMPIAKAATNYSTRDAEYVKNLTTRGEILYNNKVLIDSGKVEKKEIIYNASYTFYCYLSYYSFDEETPLYVKEKDFGHKKDNEVIRHYFVDIRNDKETFYSLFDMYNQKNQYFIRNSDTILLKEEIKEQVVAYFKTGETISDLGTKYISTIENNVFYPLYGEVMTLIQKHDLIDGDKSYNKTQSEITSYEKYIDNMVTYASFISLLISSVVLYLVIPMCNRNKKTLAMMFMRVERVGFDKLNLLKNKDVFVSFVYQILLSFMIAFITPMSLLSFYELFNISVLLIFGLLSLILSLASMVFLLFNKFNQSLTDFVSRSVYLSSEELDEIYRAKGYHI